MKKLILFALTFTALKANAQLLLEPNLGFQFGTHDFSQTATGEARDGTSSGFTMGARIGYKYTMFFGGLDLQYSLPTMVADNASIGGTNVAGSSFPIAEDWGGSLFQFGISAGVDLPIGIRAWLGYYFLGNLTTDDIYSSEYSGGAFRLGVGYKVIPLVSLNFEYVHSSFTADSRGILPAVVLDSVEMSQSAFILGVSVPYELALGI